MAVVVTTNATIFCKYEPGHTWIAVAISSDPEPLPALLHVALVRPGFGDVIVREIAGGAQQAEAILDLNSDAAGERERAARHEGINYVRRGDYYVELRDAETGMPIGRGASPIRVVPVLLDPWRSTYLFGVPLHAEHTLMPVSQPRRVTGASVRYVDPGSLKGRGVLAYDAAGKTMSWRGGDPEPVEGTAPQLLRLLTPEVDSYLEVHVEPAKLPTADAADSLLIDNARMDDATLWHYLDKAYDTIEQALQMSLEPRIVSTDPALAFCDETAAAVAREAAGGAAVALTSRHARPLRKVLNLTGHMGERQVLQVPAEWMVINSSAAIIDLRPGGGAPALFSGFLSPVGGSPAAWPTSNIAPMRSYAGFWRYRVVAGLERLDGDRYRIREAIEKQAALEVLMDLSLAATGGRTSRSAQREGVSESWSYGGQGAYAEKIGALKEWLDKNLPRMRQYFAGFTVEIL